MLIELDWYGLKNLISTIVETTASPVQPAPPRFVCGVAVTRTYLEPTIANWLAPELEVKSMLVLNEITAVRVPAKVLRFVPDVFVIPEPEPVA